MAVTTRERILSRTLEFRIDTLKAYFFSVRKQNTLNKSSSVRKTSASGEDSVWGAYRRAFGAPAEVLTEKKPLASLYNRPNFSGLLEWVNPSGASYLHDNGTILNYTVRVEGVKKWLEDGEEIQQRGVYACTLN